MVRVELACLMCGKIAGVLEDRRVVRPRAPGAVRYDVRGLSCGRCEGTLIPGDEERSPVPAADLHDDSPVSTNSMVSHPGQRAGVTPE